MSLDVEGSETDCSAIHCFKVFQRVNVKRGPPEQTNPRDIFLESIGNIVIWPPASMSGSQKDHDDTSDPTKPQNDPLARDLLFVHLTKEGIFWRKVMSPSKFCRRIQLCSLPLMDTVDQYWPNLRMG